ncbi:SPOR domain-containing protein [Patulibacter sp.]|uniref:SPOR domain-containing protein n=1 Tax=Patulibacter sp. TaxID=1912859 RepID=UPI00271768BA|nr:hypothetical protein [Patulibacter sp.]MDO9407250.1 hypothetical protein [Patulibacter sp.]
MPFLQAAALAVTLCVSTGCGGDSTKPTAKATTVAPTPGVATPQTAAPVTTRAAKPKRPLANPAGWPTTLQVGLIDPENGAAALAKRAPFGVRWHYLSGGAGTSGSWDLWRTGQGSYATAYVQDSAKTGTVPFLSYYVLQQTPPFDTLPDEHQRVLRGIKNPATMKAVVADLRLALTRMGQGGDKTSVLQIEADLWGYVQQQGEPATTKAAIAGTDALAVGLPETLAGFARLITRIRNEVAPKVLLAYPVSVFGTNKDIVGSDPTSDQVKAMAASSVRYWRSLGRPFDLMTFEYANRDAGYQVKVDGMAEKDSWWTADNEARHLEYVRGVLSGSKRAGVLWQVPPGNTVKKIMDDTPGHYRDTKVQALLGRKGRPYLKAYRDAGVVAVLFGSAFPNDTCACRRTDQYATKGDDDGGYLAAQVRKYARDGELKLTRLPKRGG